MAKKRQAHDLGIRLKPTDTAGTLEGEISIGKTSKFVKVFIDGSEREVVTKDQTQDLTNKTLTSPIIDTGVSGSAISTDGTFVAVAASDTIIPSQLAVKTYVDAQIQTKDQAIEISYDPAANPVTTAIEVQTALDDTGIASNIAQATVDTHIGDLSTAHTASAIVNVASGNLVATDVQGALDEIQTEIDALPDKIETLQNKTLDSTNIFSGSIEGPTRLDVKQDTLANLETYAGSASDGQLVFATDEQKMFQVIALELQPVGGAGGTTIEIEQVAHGLAVGEGVYHDGADWVKGQANDGSTLATFVITEVKDVDNFIAYQFGRVEVLLHGFTIGQYYFLSTTVAGQATSTEPTLDYSNPLFYVEDANTLQIMVYRPSVVGEQTVLDQLADVTIATPLEGEFLRYSGVTWENKRVEEEVISLVAAENVALGDILYITSIGQVGLVDPDDDAKMEFIGFAREAALATEDVNVVISGKLGGFTGLTVGEVVYADPINPGKIVSVEPTEGNVYVIRVGKAISATQLLVNPDLAASADFNRAVVADLPVANNQVAPASVTGLSFDGSLYRSVVLRYSIYRVSSTEEYAQTGQLRLTYKTNAASWSISDDLSGDNSGVTFSVDNTGQILYVSTNVAGASYSSNLKVNTVELFDV